MLCQGSVGTESTLRFHQETILLCPGSVGTESSMLSSGNDIVMPKKRWYREQYAFIRKRYCYMRWYREQYAFIRKRYCYAKEALVQRAVCFHQETILLCQRSVGTESSMLSSGNDIVMPKKRWYREQYAFIRKRYCYAKEALVQRAVCFHQETILLCQGSLGTESIVCFHQETILLCLGIVGTESSMLSSGNDFGMPRKRWY